MASRKKLINLDGYQVAHIDIGKGESVILLHGCPFSLYEWREVAPRLARHFRLRPICCHGTSRLATALMDKLGILAIAAIP